MKRTAGLSLGGALGSIEIDPNNMLWVSIVILLSNRHKCWVCTRASLPPGQILVDPKQIHQTRIYLNHLKSDLDLEPILLFFLCGFECFILSLSWV